ncbi:MAG: alpha-glucuronidase family glycosyl hydrolase, partial [Acidobacteriaceae bacterium]
MVDRNRAFLAFVLIAGLSGTLAAHAENGSQGWLRYAPPSAAGIPSSYQSMPAAIVKLDSSELAASAQSEMLRGVRSMLGRTLRVEATLPNEDAWVLGTTEELHAAFPQYRAPSLGAEGFAVSVVEAHGRHAWLIAGADPRGILYGTFHVLSGIGRGESFAALAGSESPAAPVRWVNQWDNLNGTIERGFAGRSIFFDNGSVRTDLTRAGDYARLLASVGINGCTINNVNADPKILTPEMMRGVARIADQFRPWGVRLSIS